MNYKYLYQQENGQLKIKVLDIAGNLIWIQTYPTYSQNAVTGKLEADPTLIDLGVMKSVDDTEGLETYLRSINVLSQEDKLVSDDEEEIYHDPSPESLIPEFAKGGQTKKRFSVYLSTEATGENFDSPDYETDDLNAAINYAKKKSNEFDPSDPHNGEYSDYKYVANVFDNVAQTIIADFADGEPNYIENQVKVYDRKYYKPSKLLFIGERVPGFFYSEKTGPVDDLTVMIEAYNPNANMAAVKSFLSSLTSSEDEITGEYYPQHYDTHYKEYRNWKLGAGKGENMATHKAAQEALRLWHHKPVSYAEIKDVHYSEGGVIEPLERSYHVRDTLVDKEVFNALPEEKKARIQELTKEYNSLGYVDARTQLGPDQAGRMSEKQRDKLTSTASRVFEIETEIKKLLTPDNVIADQEREQEIKRLEGRKLQLSRRIEDFQTIGFLWKKVQSPRKNATKTDYENTVEELDAVNLKLNELQKKQFADGGITDSGFHYGDTVEFKETSTETLGGGDTPKWRAGEKGAIKAVKKVDGKFLYTVDKFQGIGAWTEVPEDALQLANKEIHEQVEKILDEKQKTKEFKDVGKRVSGSKKERRAYSMITMNDLSALEQDEITAHQMVTKDKVYPEVNILEQKENGVSSGAAYLKVKIREACGTRPPNSKEKRASFIQFISVLTSNLNALKTVDEVLNYLSSLKELSIEHIIGYFLDTNFFNLSDEEKQRAHELYKQKFPYQSTYNITKKMLEEVFSKRFSNFVYMNSDPAQLARQQAKLYEAISKEQETINVEKYKTQKQRFIDANQDNANNYAAMPEEDLKKEFHKWSGMDTYRKDMPGFRAAAIRYYEARVERGKKELEEIPKELYAREDDWSWFETKKEKKEVQKSGEIQINVGVPLSYIKRTGGLKIDEKYVAEAQNTDPSKNPITTDFGFKSAQFGNALRNAEAREHVRHFLGAMSDIAEILDIDIVQLNNIGGLSIAFAARGAGKAAAHYERGRVIINVTNSRGDGFIAHEFGHYVDNAITMFGKDKSTLFMGSEMKRVKSWRGTTYESFIVSKAVEDAMRVIVDFFDNGKKGVTPKITQTYKANDIKRELSYHDVPTNNTKVVEPLATIEETFAYYADRSPVFNNLNYKYPDYQAKIFGQIIAHFGLEEYDVPMYSPTSAYKFYSDRMNSAYWVKPVELFARAWETYIFDKLAAAGRMNNYLVSGVYFDMKVSLKDGGYTYVYPFGDERKYIVELYDRLIDAMKSDFKLEGFKPFTTERTDEYIVLDDEDKKSDKPEAGVIVTEDKALDTVAIETTPVILAEDKKEAEPETKQPESETIPAIPGTNEPKWNFGNYYNADVPASPLLDQVVAVKNANPDALVMVNTGSFYEAYGVDAKVIADILNIVLATGVGGFLTTGFPHHDWDWYSEKLQDAGHKIVIIENPESIYPYDSGSELEDVMESIEEQDLPVEESVEELKPLWHMDSFADFKKALDAKWENEENPDVIIYSYGGKELARYSTREEVNYGPLRRAYYKEIRDAIDNNLYVDAIEKGILSRRQAIDIITGAYEEVPESVLKARSKHEIRQDKFRKAKRPGKRKSAAGNVYYESRANRSDENPRAKFEDGGDVSGHSKSAMLFAQDQMRFYYNDKSAAYLQQALESVNGEIARADNNIKENKQVEVWTDYKQNYEALADLLKQKIEVRLAQTELSEEEKLRLASDWWSTNLSTNEQKALANKHLSEYDADKLFRNLKYTPKAQYKKLVQEIWEKEGRPEAVNPYPQFEHGGVASDVREPLYYDKYNKPIVFDDGEYQIAVNDIDKATYVSLWFNGKKIGDLHLGEARESETKGYMQIQNVEIDKKHRGKGLGKKMYLAALKYSDADKKGIASEYAQRSNRKQVPSILKSIGGRELPSGDVLVERYADGGDVDSVDHDEYWYNKELRKIEEEYEKRYEGLDNNSTEWYGEAKRLNDERQKKIDVLQKKVRSYYAHLNNGWKPHFTKNAFGKKYSAGYIKEKGGILDMFDSGAVVPMTVNFFISVWGSQSESKYLPIENLSAPFAGDYNQAVEEAKNRVEKAMESHRDAFANVKQNEQLVCTVYADGEVLQSSKAVINKMYEAGGRVYDVTDNLLKEFDYAKESASRYTDHKWMNRIPKSVTRDQLSFIPESGLRDKRYSRALIYGFSGLSTEQRKLMIAGLKNKLLRAVEAFNPEGYIIQHVDNFSGGGQPDKKKELEKLHAKRDKLEERLHAEKLRLHSQIHNMGWGAGMRRVKVTPSFRKEDELQEKLDAVNRDIAEMEGRSYSEGGDVANLPERTPVKDLTLEQYKQKIAEAERKPEHTSSQIDWGAKKRGQGRRNGHMVTGSMSDAPRGIRTYWGIKMNVPDRQEHWEDLKRLKGYEALAYMQSRYAGFNHRESMFYAINQDAEKAYNLILKDKKLNEENYAGGGDLFENIDDVEATELEYIKLSDEIQYLYINLKCAEYDMQDLESENASPAEIAEKREEIDLLMQRIQEAEAKYQILEDIDYEGEKKRLENMQQFETGGDVSMSHAEQFKNKYGIDALELFNKAKALMKEHKMDFSSALSEALRNAGLHDSVDEEEVIYGLLESDISEISLPKSDRIYNSGEKKTFDIKPINKPLPGKTEPIKALASIVSQDDLRPAMMGVYKNAKDDALIATNANVLAVLPHRITGESKVVDIKTGEELKDSDGNPYRFPDYKSAIPTGNIFQFKNIPLKKLYDQVYAIAKANSLFIHSISLAASIEILDGQYTFDPHLFLDLLTFFARVGVDHVDLELSPVKGQGLNRDEEVYSRAMIIRGNPYNTIFGLLMPTMGSPLSARLKLPPMELPKNWEEELRTNNHSIKYHTEQLEKAKDEKSEWGIEYHEKELAKAKGKVEEVIAALGGQSLVEDHKPSDLPKNGSPIYIHAPALGRFEEEDLILKYDKKNFLFDVYVYGRKVNTISERAVLNNLDNGTYVLSGPPQSLEGKSLEELGKMLDKNINACRKIEKQMTNAIRHNNYKAHEELEQELATKKLEGDKIIDAMKELEFKKETSKNHLSYEEAIKKPKGGASAMTADNLQATAADSIGGLIGVKGKTLYDWANKHGINLVGDGKVGAILTNSDNRSNVLDDILSDKRKHFDILLNGTNKKQRISFNDFLAGKGYEKWYKSQKPIERYEESGSKRLTNKQYEELEQEYFSIYGKPDYLKEVEEDKSSNKPKENSILAKAGIKKKEEKEKRSPLAIAQDKARKAMKPGKRESDSGNTYYETRDNRSDEDRRKKL